MKGPVAVTTVVLIIFGVSLLAPPSEASWAALVPALTAKLTSLWQNKDLQFMGYTCYYSVKPKIKKWQLYFDGRFSCPTWTNIRGKALTRSKSGVMTKTIVNFLQQAKDRNIVTEEEANKWLQETKTTS